MIHDVIPNNTKLWFEYHCDTQETSKDYWLYLRTHQQVTVIKLTDPDNTCENTTLAERGENGIPLVYTVEFSDGVTGDVFEDELMNSQNDFQFTVPYQPGQRIKHDETICRN